MLAAELGPDTGGTHEGWSNDPSPALDPRGAQADEGRPGRARSRSGLRWSARAGCRLVDVRRRRVACVTARLDLLIRGVTVGHGADDGAPAGSDRRVPRVARCPVLQSHRCHYSRSTLSEALLAKQRDTKVNRKADWPAEITNPQIFF